LKTRRSDQPLGRNGRWRDGRGHRILVEGKPDLPGTADPTFRGDPDIHNPEDLFLAAISACHMLTYLALCARQGVRVLAYEDHARGRMVTDERGGGKFEEVELRPRVTIDAEDRTALATRLHETAHELCFIANSCSVPLRHSATVISA
jgi:organic hydroperoxide reductase OsmC/OhrA